ncbi:MAG: metal-dependent hydrolase [Pseudorhodoplanes sp.]
MDSLTHIALGSALGIVAMRGRTAPWKAALVGAACNTLPDLDVFIHHGDAVSNVTLHRAESHAVFWLSVASPVVAFVAAAIFRDLVQYRRWWLMVWVALISHPILDAFTIYGTQIARPFTDESFGIGSIFIIDPLYTLPLIAGAVVALSLRNTNGWRWALGGLALSTLYLGWGVVAQHQVLRIAKASLKSQGIPADRVLATPTAFNSILWRIVAVTPDAYLEGFHSMLDRDRNIAFDSFPRGMQLHAAMAGNRFIDRVAQWTHGFYKLGERDGRIVVTDLRMGQEPFYSFNFVVGQRQSPTIAAVTPTSFREQHKISEGLRWLWRRMLGEPLPPPR